MTFLFHFFFSSSYCKEIIQGEPPAVYLKFTPNEILISEENSEQIKRLVLSPDCYCVQGLNSTSTIDCRFVDGVAREEKSQKTSRKGHIIRPDAGKRDRMMEQFPFKPEKNTVEICEVKKFGRN